MALIPIDQYKKSASKKQSFGKLKPLAPKPVQAVQRPDIRQSENYKNAVLNADRMKQEADKASSFRGMAANALKAAPQAAADVLVGTPAKFIASALEAPVVAYKGKYTDRTYKVPGLSPFKSFQSDFGQVEKDVIEGRKGLGSAAWELAKIPLAGLETGVLGGGLSRGVKALASGNVRQAAAQVSDAVLPTNFSRSTPRSKILGTDRQGLNQIPAQLETPLKPLPPKEGGISMPLLRGQESSSYRSDNIIPEQVQSIKGLPKEAPTGSKYYPNIFRSGESSLTNQGQAGEKLKNLMKDEQVSADLQAGKWKSLVQKFSGGTNIRIPFTDKNNPDNYFNLGGLTVKQKSNLTDVLEGKANPVDKAVADSSVVMRNLLNKIQRTAKDTGLDVGYREDYFPRQYNWDEITKGKRHEEVLQHMVESGQASTKAEAENFLKDFIGKNRERKAGNLEYERLFDIPGYEKDPEKALTMYADSAAKRISEAKSFGAKDEVSSALINKIAEGGGDYQQAQKIFDNVYKGEDKNAFAQFLLGYNAFTKLSLGFFSNLTQSVNTASKAGLLNTVKGAGQALAQGIKAVKGKNYDDLAVLANTLDDHVMLQESGLSNKFIQGSMYLFQKVENFNRRTATYAGKYRAEELANILKSDPQSAFASRQLESLGIKVEDIVKGKLTQEQLAKAANKMTRITQFKIDSLNLPTAWRTPLGKVLSQFKSFSFMQTKFIRDEIVKEARLGNFAPLARFIAIAPMASFLTQSARNAVNQVDPKNEKANPSFRKGDLYRKAIGDLPSDFVTQMKYAYDKSQATYQDAKGNQYPSTTALQDIKNFTSPFTGPSISDAAELMSSIDRVSSIKERNNAWYGNHEAAQSDPYLDLKRFATTKIPFVGRGLTNRFLPYEKTDAKKAKELFKEGLRTNNRDLIDQAIQDDPYLYNEKVVRSIIGGKVKDMSQKEKELYEEIRNMKKSGQPFYK